MSTMPTAVENRLASLLEEAGIRAGDLLGGRYEILSRIARGGCGEVFRARDRVLGRVVAIKIPRWASPRDLDRFRREAERQSRLDHPGVAPIYDAGMDGAIPYFVLRLVPGVPAHAAGLDRTAAVRAVRDAALALHEAHRVGLVHRDVKPDNLLVHGDRVTVIDFGIARDLTGVGDTGASVEVCGTPAYMSPEQARGLPVGARADVYSLGATLRCLLSGRSKASPVRAGVRVGPGGAPETCPADAGGVDADLEAVVRRCLETEAARRYPDAQALADDLGLWLAGEPVRARPLPFFARWAAALRRRARPAAMAMAAAAIVAGVFAIAPQGNEEAAGPPRSPGLRKVGAELLDARMVDACLAGATARGAGTVPAPGADPPAEAVPDADPGSADSLTRRAVARATAGDFGGAEEDLDRALALADGHAVARLYRGLVRLRLGDPAGAAADFDRSVRSRPEASEPYLFRGLAWKSAGEPERAATDLEQAFRFAPAGWPGREQAREALREIRGDRTREFPNAR